jgi:amino acid transporter
MAKTVGAPAGAPGRLKEGVLSVPDVVFTSIASQAPGGAVALNFFFAALFAGAAFPFAMLVSLVATLFLASTLSQFSRHLSSASGFGIFAARGLGPRAGFFTSWSALFYGLLFPAEVVVLVSKVLADQLEPVLGFEMPWQIFDVVFIGIIWFIAYRGVKGSARVAVTLGSIEIAIFLLLGFWLVIKAGHHNTLKVFTPTTGTFGLAWGLIYGFLSFTGFESIASLAEETKDPKRNVGRCAFAALILVGIFYVFLAYAGIVGWGVDAINTGPHPFSGDAFAYGTLAHGLWVPFKWIVLIAILNSTIACSLAALNFAVRYLYSLGRLDLLPARLGETHPEHRTPHVAIHFMAIVSIVLSVGLGSWWGTTLAFGFLATAFTFGWIFMFATTNLALPYFYKREHPAEFSVRKHVVYPIIGTVALIPALVAPLLPLLPQFKSAGPIPWQIAATVPLTLIWMAAGVYLARRMQSERADKLAHISDDHVPVPQTA